MSNPDNKSKSELERYLLHEIITEALATLDMDEAQLIVDTVPWGGNTIARCGINYQRQPYLTFGLGEDRLMVQHAGNYTELCRLYQPEYSELIQRTIVDHYGRFLNCAVQWNLQQIGEIEHKIKKLRRELRVHRARAVEHLQEYDRLLAIAIRQPPRPPGEPR